MKYLFIGVLLAVMLAAGCTTTVGPDGTQTTAIDMDSVTALGNFILAWEAAHKPTAEETAQQAADREAKLELIREIIAAVREYQANGTAADNADLKEAREALLDYFATKDSTALMQWLNERHLGNVAEKLQEKAG